MTHANARRGLSTARLFCPIVLTYACGSSSAHRSARISVMRVINGRLMHRERGGNERRHCRSGGPVDDRHNIKIQRVQSGRCLEQCHGGLGVRGAEPWLTMLLPVIVRVTLPREILEFHKPHRTGRRTSVSGRFGWTAPRDSARHGKPEETAGVQCRNWEFFSLRWKIQGPKNSKDRRSRGNRKLIARRVGGTSAANASNRPGSDPPRAKRSRACDEDLRSSAWARNAGFVHKITIDVVPGWQDWVRVTAIIVFSKFV